MIKIFATLDGSGAPVQLQPGQPFTTWRATVTDEQEAAWSFTPVGAPTDFEVNHPANALDLYGAEDLARFGIVALEIPAAQAGEVQSSVGLGIEAGVIVADPVYAPIPPAPVPLAVTRAAAKTALAAAGKFGAFRDAALAMGPAGDILWNDESVWRRDNETLAALGVALNLDLDTLFRAAPAA